MKILDSRHIADAEECARSIGRSVLGDMADDIIERAIDREIEHDMVRTLSGKDDKFADDILLEDEAETDELYPCARIPNADFISSLDAGILYDPDFLLKKLEQDREDGNMTGAWHDIAQLYGTDAADRFLQTGEVDFL